MQLEPDPVARVDVGAVDPAAVAGTGPRQCGGEAVVVTAEPGEDGGQPRGERAEPGADGGQLVQHPGVPHGVAVVVDREPVAVRRSQLPVGAGAAQARVERQERVVNGGDLGLRRAAGLRQLCGQEAFVLGPARVRQRPPGEIGERRVLDPPARGRVGQQLGRRVDVQAEPPGHRRGVGEPADADGVQDQQACRGLAGHAPFPCRAARRVKCCWHA